MAHLAAKRAVVEGDTAAARDAWQRCLALDPESPAVNQNLLRLSMHAGDTQGAARFDRRLEELWGLYAEAGREGVLVRASARAKLALDADMDAVLERLQKQEKKPSVAEMTNLVHRWARAEAQRRLVLEPALAVDLGGSAVAALISGAPKSVLESALSILARPLGGEPPIAYGYFGATKNVSPANLAKARDDWRAELERDMAERRRVGVSTADYERLIERGLTATRILFDPATRARYDDATLPAPRADFCYGHAQGFRRLVDLSCFVADEGEADRGPLATLLGRIPRVVIGPYLSVGLRDEGWLVWALQRVRYAGLISQGFRLLEKGEVDAAIDLCAKLDASQRALGVALESGVGPPPPYGRPVERREGERVAGGRRRALARARRGPALPLVRPGAGHGGHPGAREAARREIAQRVATVRAGKLLEHNRTADALAVLWDVYPGYRGKPMPTRAPRASAFPLAPAGPPGFAFRVAQALREDVVSWFNTTRPTTRIEVEQRKSLARSVTSGAARWARYAAEQARGDPGTQPLAQAAMRLLETLGKDEARLA